MGDYTNAADLRKLFKKIDTTDLKDIDLEFFVRMAESEINGKIVQLYTLPFSETPPMLRSIASEASLIKVLDRFFTGETSSENDWRDVRKRDLKKQVDGIVDGSISLVNSAGDIIATRTDIGSIASSTIGYTPIFGHGSVVNEEVDPDRIDDEEDAKD